MDIEQEVKSAMPAVMERIKREAIQRIEREALNAATEVALQAAKEWAIEHLVPEVKAQMEAGKAGMVAAAEQAAKGIGDALSKAMIEQATKTLASSHSLNSVAEKLFRGY